MSDDNGTRWKWGWPAVTSLVACIGAGGTVSAYVAGRDAAIRQAAVDHKRLADVEAMTEAAADRIGERVVVDAVQDTRIDTLERRHAEVIERLNKLIDVLWDRRRSDEARRPGG